MKKKTKKTKSSFVALRDKETGRFTKWSATKTVKVEVYKDGKKIDETPRWKVYTKEQLAKSIKVSKEMIKPKKARSKEWKVLRERIEFFNENFYSTGLKRFFAYYYLLEKLRVNCSDFLSEEKIYEIWQDLYKNTDFSEFDDMLQIKDWSDGIINDIFAEHNILRPVIEPEIGIDSYGQLGEINPEPEPELEPEPEPESPAKKTKKAPAKKSKKAPAKKSKKAPAKKSKKAPAKKSKKAPAKKSKKAPAKKSKKAPAKKSTKPPAKKKSAKTVIKKSAKAVKNEKGRKANHTVSKSVKTKRSKKVSKKGNRN